MKRKIRNWIYRLARKVIAKHIIKHGRTLHPNDLIKLGWVEKDGYYTEPNIKDRDRITIQFENHYYRVWHSADKTFIALESTYEWFEMYYLLIHSDNGIYELAGI
jgi:hypothetical protein|tara:strand:- start:3831 stop:4145 length:315 start_codon:yes stop_codon:yes gene_type:complete